MFTTRRSRLSLVILTLTAVPVSAQDYKLHTFDRKQLTDIYYSEGANAGDLNHDGKLDAVYGPHWYEGPDFVARHEIYPAKPQNREGYADHFFHWVFDVNGDGWNDVLTVGFPGRPGFVYENPKAGNVDKPWPKHEVLASVSNESPQFVNLVGDERPELVCTSNGQYGYATFDPSKGFAPWTFVPISAKPAPKPFGHGLGVGDVNGDGRNDVLISSGWFEQPKESPDTTRWEFHPAAFTPAYGGAEMHVYDVDGDGLNDVITSLAAHDFGLAWYKQVRTDGATSFQQHLILGDKPSDNPFGLVFSELHSLALADIDGDGRKDIVTGKTYYSHHKQSPMWDAGAVVYWFRLVRTPKGVQWVPHKIDGEAGIGRQVSIADVNGDGLLDIVVGGMVGGHVLTHRVRTVTLEEWEAAQPKAVVFAAPKRVRGAPSVLDPKTGRATGAVEGEELHVLTVSAGKTGTQKMAAFTKDKWSGDAQLFWSGAKVGATLTLRFDAPVAGSYDLAVVTTLASDYATVQFAVDDTPLGKPIDLYHTPDVITSGVLKLGTVELTAGSHRMVLRITGANPSAVPKHMVGLDYIRLTPVK